MPFPLKQDYKPAGPLCQISFADLNTLCGMLNGVDIEMIPGLDIAEVVPPGQNGRGWTFRIPAGAPLENTTGKTKGMVKQITDDTTTPPTAGYDMIRFTA